MGGTILQIETERKRKARRKTDICFFWRRIPTTLRRYYPPVVQIPALPCELLLFQSEWYKTSCSSH